MRTASCCAKQNSCLSPALSLARSLQVGLLDVDICGPSVPKLTGLENQEIHRSNLGWSPVYVEDNLAVMSIGFLLPNPDDAVIWRGPRKNGLIKQFLKVITILRPKHFSASQVTFDPSCFQADSATNLPPRMCWSHRSVSTQKAERRNCRVVFILAAGCALGRAGLPYCGHPTRHLR